MDSFESTDDKRTANNTSRHQYRTLTENEKIDISAIKSAGENFLKTIDTVASHYYNVVGPNRELALARTKIEEAVMWSVKGVTK